MPGDAQLSEWQLENVNQKFLMPIDVETYRKLRNHIAKPLVPLLQVWLFASHKAGSFEKRYDELCEILNVARYRVPSLITRQLKPSLDELTEHEYLKAWRIERTSDQKAFKIVLFHGPKFHRDRRKREQKRASVPVIIAQSEPADPALPEPGTLQDERARGAPAPENAVLVEALTVRGVMQSTAAALVAAKSGDELARVRGWIEYWDGIAGEKRAGLLVSFLTKLDPLPASFETSEARERRQAEEHRKETLRRGREALEAAYREHSDAVVDRHIESMSAEELQRLTSAYQEDIVKEGGFFAQFDGKPWPVLDNAVRSLVRAPFLYDSCIHDSTPVYPGAHHGLLVNHPASRPHSSGRA